MASVARRVSNALTTNESSKTQPLAGPSAQQRQLEVKAANSPPQKEREASTKQKNMRGAGSVLVNYVAADQRELTSMPTLNPTNVKNTHLLSLIDALKREAQELREEVDVKNQTIITLANSLYETDSALHLARASEKNHEEQRQMFTTELVEMKNTSNAAATLREKIARLESDLATAEQLFAAPLRSELDLLRQQREADDAKLLDWKNKVKEALKESKRKEQTLADERAALAEKLDKAELKLTELGFELERLNNNVGGLARKGRPCDYGTMTDEVADEQWLLAQRGMAVGDGRIGINSPLSLAGLNTMGCLGAAESQLPRHADLQRQFGHLIPSAAEILAPLFEYEPSSAAVMNAKDPQVAAYAVASFRLAQQLAPAGTCFLYAGSGGDASAIGSDITHTSLFTAAMRLQQRLSQGKSLPVVDGKRGGAVHNHGNGAFLQSPTMGPTSAFNFNGSIANPSGYVPAPQSTAFPKAPPPLLSPHTPQHTLSAAAATMMATSNDGSGAFGGMVESPTTQHSASSAEVSPSFASAVKDNFYSLVTAADRKNKGQTNAAAAKGEDDENSNGVDGRRKGGVVHVITSNNNNCVANSTSNSRASTPTPSYQTQNIITAPTGPATGLHHHPAYFQYDTFHNNNTSLTSTVGGVALPSSTHYASNNNRAIIAVDGARSPRLEPGATSPLDPHHDDDYARIYTHAGINNNSSDHHDHQRQRAVMLLHPDPPSAMAVAEAAQIPRYPYYAPDGIERSAFLGLSPLQQRVVGMARRYFYGLLERDKAKQLHPTTNSSGSPQDGQGGGDMHYTFSSGGSGSVGFPLGSPAHAAKTFAVVGTGGGAGGGGGSKAVSSSPSTSSPFSPTSGAGSAQLPPASAIDLYADLLSGSKKTTLKKSTADGGPSPMSSTTTSTTASSQQQQRKGTTEAEALPFIVTVRFSGTQASANDVSDLPAPSDSPSSPPSSSAWSLDAKMLVKPGMSVFDLVVSCCSKFSMRYDSSLEPSDMALAIHHDPSRRRITLAPHRDVHSFTYIAKKAQDGQNVVLSLIHKNPLAESVERVMDTMV